LVGGVVGFLYNERLKRRSEEDLRKEERHRKVLSTLRGFYTGAEDWSLKREFANEVAGLPSDERARLDDSLLLGIAEGIAREEWPPMECATTSLEVGYFSGENYACGG
jgi:hypothetical protein